VAGLVLAIGVAGCSGGSTSSDLSNEQKHIFHTVELINQYAVATKKQASSIEDVKDWAVKEGKGTAEDFTSSRDNQTYVLASTPGMASTVVHEKDGKGGKCYIYRMGQVSEINKDDIPNAIKTVQSMGRPGGMAGGMPGRMKGAGGPPGKPDSK
jgi:hypothetical protein